MSESQPAPSHAPFSAFDVIRDAAYALARGSAAWGLLCLIATVAIVALNRAIDPVVTSLELASPQLGVVVAFPARVPFAAAMLAVGAATALQVLRERKPSARGVLGEILRDGAAPLRAALRYLVTVVIALAMCVVPGVVFVSRHFLVTAVALDEDIAGPRALDRAREVASPGAVTVGAFGAVGLGLRAAFNLLVWPATDSLAASIGGGDGGWLLLACVHQSLQLVTYALEGALCAALYLRLRTPAVDAPALASVFE